MLIIRDRAPPSRKLPSETPFRPLYVSAAPPSKSIARSGMRLWRIRYRCDTFLRLDCRVPSDRQPSSRETQRTLPVCLTKTSDLCLTRPSGAPCALWMGNVASAHCLWHGNPFRPKSVTAAAVTKTSAVMPCIQPPSGASSIRPVHSVRYLKRPRAVKSFKKKTENYWFTEGDGASFAMVKLSIT